MLHTPTTIPAPSKAAARKVPRVITTALACSLLLGGLTNAKAQEQDFGAWYALGVEKPILRWLDVSVSPELRYFENHSRLKSWLVETDLTAKVNNYLRVGALYRYSVDFSNHETNKRSNRLGAFVKATYRLKPIDLAYRCQLQEQFTNYHSSADGKIPEVVWRHKFEVAYSKKKYAFSPYAYAEWFKTLSPQSDANEQKLRLSIGMDYKFSKRLKASLGYMRQTEYNVKNPQTMNVIATQLKYEWK